MIENAQDIAIMLTDRFPEIEGHRREELAASFSEAIEWGRKDQMELQLSKECIDENGIPKFNFDGVCMECKQSVDAVKLSDFRTLAFRYDKVIKCLKDVMRVDGVISYSSSDAALILAAEDYVKCKELMFNDFDDEDERV